MLLPLVAVSLAAGVALGLRLQPQPGPTLALATLALAASLVLVRGRPLATLTGLGMAALMAGASLGAVAVNRPLPACHVVHRADGRTRWRLQGRVAAPPTPTRSGARVVLDAESLVAPETARLCGRVEVHLDTPLPLEAGEQVVVRTRLRPAVGSRNPGTEASRLRYLSADIGAVGYVAPGTVAVLERRRSPLLQRLRQQVRRRLREAAPSGAPRQILAALVLGERAGVQPPVRDAFARAGVSHLLAVSGLHLTLLAGGLMWLLRRLLLRVTWLARRTDVRWVAAPLAACGAVAYTLLTGAAPSTTRACIMACACLLGLGAGRAPDLFRPLALAVVVLLVADPLNLLRPGFQLSFLAVLGIGLVASRVRGGRGLWAAARSLAITTLVATAITAPVVALHFHQVSVVGLLTNIVAIPITTFLLLPLSLVGAALGLACPVLGVPVLGAAAWVAARLYGLCCLMAGADLAVLRWSPPALLAAAVTVVVAAALVRRRWARRSLIVGAAVLLVLWGGGVLWRRLSPRLELDFLDVGQGDAAFVQLPGGATMLVDGGGSQAGSWDPGESRILPFLAARGVRRLDLVLASHPHPDHVKGLYSVLDRVRVDELWVCWHDEPNPWLEQLIAHARRRGTRVGRPRPRQIGEVRLRPLWPRGRDRCADPGFSANDNSVVLRLEYGAAAALLVGDVEAVAEHELVRRSAGALRAQLLKVPHHGSASSSTPALLEAVAPRLAVVSCGAGNSFGFPDPRVLQRYRRAGIPVARTDRLGAIGVELWPDGRLRWRPLTGL